MQYQLTPSFFKALLEMRDKAKDDYFLKSAIVFLSYPYKELVRRDFINVNMKELKESIGIMPLEDLVQYYQTVLSMLDNIGDDVKDIAQKVIEYLNEKAGTTFKADAKNTLKLIQARVNEGYTMAEFKLVIDKKVAHWKDTSQEKYLRPITLFNPIKFETYLNESGKVIKDDNRQQQKPNSVRSTIGAVSKAKQVDW